jgi:gliding motility-associated-like protein
MIKLQRVLLVFILTFIPLLGICQVDVPKWVDDIGGPSSNCISSDVGVDKQNNIYVTGFFSGTADFDPSSGVYNLTAQGEYDTFIAKYTTNGTLVWAVSIGGDGTTQVNSIAVDENGNPSVSGQFTDNTLTAGSIALQNNGGYDAFVVKLNTNGTFMWAKDIGGGGTDYGQKVIADSQGDVIETVRYSSTVTVGTQTFSSAAAGNFNALTIKYDPNGNVLWAVNIADPTDSEALTCDVDAQDDIIVGGYFDGNDNFNPLGTAHNLNGNGIFIAKYTPAGILMWVTDFTGVSSHSVGVCVDSQGNVFGNGHFTSIMQFAGTTVTLNPTGSQDLFVVKYSSAGIFQNAIDIGGTGASIFNYGIHPSHDGNVLIGGYFSGTVDFDPSPATKALVTYHGQQDFFLAKYDDNLNYKWAFGGGSSMCSQTLGRNVAIDYNNGVIYTGGFCSTVNFSASSCSAYNLTAQSVRDCFLGKYTQNSATTTEQITGFSVPQQSAPAVIDQTNLIITVTVPKGTNVTALVPTIAYTSGVTLTPASGIAENFTSGITYTLSLNCSNLNYTVNVVYSEIPKPLTVCGGDTTTLIGDTENPVPSSYLWQTQINSIWSTATGTNSNANYTTPVLINNTAANIVVDYRRQIITAGDTTYDSYYDITVLPQLTNNTITNPAGGAYCLSVNPGNITGTTPTGGAGAYTYQWQISSDGTTFTNINGATGINYNSPSLNSTTYYQRIVMSGTCGVSTSNVISIIVNQPPAPPASVVTQTCSGTAATITISDAQAGLTYNWYSDANRTNLLFTGTTYVTGPISTNTNFYIESANASCTSTTLATAQVIVEPLPVEPSVNNSIITTCSGTQLTLNIVNPQTGFTYNWYTAATGGTPVSTGIDFVTPVLSQNISYYAEAVDANGCISAIRTPINITVAPLPDISAQGAPACPGTSAVLTAQSIDPNTTINWYADATGGSILFTGSSFTTPDLSTATTYYAESVDKTTGCISTSRASATVTILTQLAVPVVTVENTSPTAITFEWTAVQGAAGYKVSIDNGVTFTDPSSGSNGLSTTISDLQTGQTVILIVEAVGTYVCQTSTTSIPVSAVAQYPQNSIIYVANAFTPNGDGKNDIVYVHGDGIQSMSFHIYDQFGELIFTSNSLTIGWDGTYKGTKQPVGVYVYYVQATMYNGQKLTKKGTITLLR